MSSSSEVTEFNAVEKLALPTEDVVQVNSNLSAVDNVNNNNVNSIVADSIQEEQTRIPRFRTLTERGQAYQEDRQRERDKEEDQLIKRFHEAFDAWKAQASDIERYIADQLPLSQTDKDENIFRLKDLHVSALTIYEKLRKFRPPGQEIRQKMDACDALTKTLEHQLKQSEDSIPISRNDRRSVRSRRSRSIISGNSRVSKSSRVSSLIDLRKADAVAELAAKEAELNALQEEAKRKEEITKMEAQLRAETTRIESELAKRKLELEQMEVKKQLDMARARLKAYQVAEEIENEKDPVEDDLSRASLIQTTPASLPPLQDPRHLRSDVTASRVTQPTQQLQDVHKSPSVLQGSSSADKTAEIITTIADSFSLSRLPAPEPITFSGEPIHCPDWKSSFYALIHRKNLPLCDKMYYLKRYVSGSAKQAISGLFLQSSSEAYVQAWSILDERFGHPFIVTKAYRDKLQGWPKIGAKDHQGLRGFADFLTSIDTAMQTIKDLTIPNDYMENQKLLAKLPDWLISRWNREATREMKEHKRYPDFKTFTAFINAEADLASNPISSCNAVKEVGAASVKTYQALKSKDIGDMTVHSIQKIEDNSEEAKETPKPKPQCTFCRKTDHHLDACPKFKTETLEKRLRFVKENRLCFGCLSKGHVSSDCRKKLTCSSCNKKHPTCLHQERRETRKTEERRVDYESSNVPKPTSCNCTSQGASSSTSMIVPVWLSSSKRPEAEVLVYAILDTQSDSTFVLKETCDELDADKQATKLRLSTITSQESVVDSQRVSGLQVRGYNSDLKIPIPVAYTSTSICRFN